MEQRKTCRARRLEVQGGRVRRYAGDKARWRSLSERLSNGAKRWDDVKIEGRSVAVAALQKLCGAKGGRLSW
jgi:hypothetical protein